jgi:hypothetical protein
MNPGTGFEPLAALASALNTPDNTELKLGAREGPAAAAAFPSALHLTDGSTGGGGALFGALLEANDQASCRLVEKECRHYREPVGFSYD